MTLEVRYYGGGYELYENVLEILNVPDTMNIIVKCGYPHWCKYALIRKDIKNMEVTL